jgi:DNA-binding PadR family transcriptional regulator
VLGFVARLGPSTPYDLKRAVSQSVAYFWDFPHSQLYVEPERLAGLGLLSEEQEEHGLARPGRRCSTRPTAASPGSSSD